MAVALAQAIGAARITAGPERALVQPLDRQGVTQRLRQYG